MKAKNNIPRKREQPKPLLAPSFNVKNWKDLLPYQKEAYFLAKARLENGEEMGHCHIDAINWLHHRVLALCDIVGEAAYSESGSEMPGESLAVVMGIIQEDIRVAGCITNNLDHLCRDPGGLPSAGAA
jgi:hypothetical protein